MGQMNKAHRIKEFLNSINRSKGFLILILKVDPIAVDLWACLSPLLKGKERKSIYIAPFCTKVHSKRSGMDHTVLPANNTMPAFPSWRSPDVTTTATEAADIQLQLTTHLSTPKG